MSRWRLRLILTSAIFVLAACSDQDGSDQDGLDQSSSNENLSDRQQGEVKPVGACDRACLTSFVDQYLSALSAHDPSQLPTTDTVRFTEDAVEMNLGEGLWQTISSVSNYRLDFVDVNNSTVISHNLIEDDGNKAFLALRLKVEGDKVSEIETMVVRNREEGMIFNPDALVTVSEAMLYKPQPEQLNSREEMIQMASLYPEGLKTGSFVTVDVPFTDTAYRFENGQLMAGPGCTFFPGCENIKTQRIPTLAGLTYTVGAVDEEYGIVLIRMDFGPGATFDGNNSLNVWEAFKVYDGKVHAVEAFMETIPIGTPHGWGGYN